MCDAARDHTNMCARATSGSREKATRTSLHPYQTKRSMGRSAAAPLETDCSQCMANTNFCVKCLQNFSLPFLEHVDFLRDDHTSKWASPGDRDEWTTSGFSRFQSIYLMTTPRRWEERGEVMRRRLRGALIGPQVLVVNGTGVDELHAAQILRQGVGQRRHFLAASWAHVLVAQHALKLKHEMILLIEDDAMFKLGAATMLNTGLASLDAMRHTPMGNWSLMRLGYSYRWTRALSRCDATAASQFVVATGPRDIRSSVAVAYRGDGIRRAAGMRFYHFAITKAIDMALAMAGLWATEHLAMPPLVAQSSVTAPRKVSAHLTSALVLLGKCANLTTKSALASPAGSSVRAAWPAWNRTGDLALSATLLNWTQARARWSASSVATNVRA